MSDGRSMRIILNPASRGGAGGRARTRIAAGLPQASIVETTHAGHATSLAAQAAADGIDIIVAAGGDGTIHEVANGILDATDRSGQRGDRPGGGQHGSDRRASSPSLGVIPIGTGNDFVKIVPGAHTLTAAMSTLMTGRPRAFDVGLTEWSGNREYFVNAMGTGVDVEVVRQIRKLSRGTGAMVYMQGLVRALRLYDPIPLTIHADGEDLSKRIMIIAVSNGRSVGGSFRMAPHAQPDDGLLDLCVVAEVSLAGQVVLVPRIVMGTHESSKRVATRRVRNVTLSVPHGEALFFQLDGELREPEGVREIRVSVQPGRLQVITSGEQL